MSTKARKILEKAVGPLTFGMLLRAYMDREDLTQNELADRLEVNKTYISSLLSGRKKVSIDKALEIASILGEPKKTYTQVAIRDLLRKSGIECEVILKNFDSAA